MLTSRFNSVKRWPYLFLLSLVIVAGGCGGSSINSGLGSPGEVAGVVFDSDGNVVRNADVFIDNPSIQTVSNSPGTYILRNVPAEDLIVRATVSENGVTYIGQNLARVFNNDRAR